MWDDTKSASPMLQDGAVIGRQMRKCRTDLVQFELHGSACVPVAIYLQTCRIYYALIFPSALTSLRRQVSILLFVSFLSRVYLYHYGWYAFYVGRLPAASHGSCIDVSTAALYLLHSREDWGFPSNCEATQLSILPLAWSRTSPSAARLRPFFFN